ncbi:MAG: M56 family metallopeptidase [Anaerolineae bacterium]
MQFGLGHRGRITADATFCGLVVLAFGVLGALSGFVAYFAPIYDSCKSMWDNLLLRASYLGFLLPITIAGSVVILAGLTLVRQWRATRRLLRDLAPHRVPVPSRLFRIAQEVGLQDRIDCVSDVISAPFCYGFIRPRVCVPTVFLDWLDDSELRAVLRHEAYHTESRDPLKVWLSRALARGLYFLPLARDLRDSYLAAKEVAADETTAEIDELPLASALVKMLSAGGRQLELATPALNLVWPEARPELDAGHRRRAEVAVGVLGHASAVGLVSVTRVPSNQTEERLRRLIDGRPAQLMLPSVKSIVFSAVIVVAIFAASATNLSAVSVVPVSQECSAESVRRQPQAALPRAQDTAMTVVWPVDTLEMDTGPIEQTVAGPDATFSRLGCDLLKPTCRSSLITDH